MIKKYIYFSLVSVLFSSINVAESKVYFINLKDGDIVYYDKHAGHAISWKDELYHVIRSGDVVLVE